MKLIIDGDYDEDLITQIGKKNLSVSHVIVHVPQNPIGNGSIFLPKKNPTFEEFKNYTKTIQDNGIIPIAGIDSTCQGNLEAHMEQYKATKKLFETLQGLEYKNLLVSSPNNIGFVKENYFSSKIYLSYSQYVTSLNRGKIFFEIGADNIILHPDIIRYFRILKNFIKIKQEFKKTKEIDCILPLNIGCNWGCIHWYQHHNMQSHRTINSPVFPNQEELSDVENEFDYPLLYCWKERLENPENLLKSGWISPSNIEQYENLGYETYVLYTGGFSTDKIVRIINNYDNKELSVNFEEILNIPQPYGNYWSRDGVKNSMMQLKPEIINEFCEKFPYQLHYPEENEIDEYCIEYAKKLHNGNIQHQDKIIDIIKNKMNNMEKGVIKR
ncbi:MAG: hypothetical protein ACFFBP_14160 [Promethearchaeota archaeon]